MWWHAGRTKHGQTGFAFEVPRSWDAWGGEDQTVHLQGEFQDGDLPAGIDVSIIAPYGDSPRLGDTEWEGARIEQTLVDEKRAEVLHWRPSYDPDPPTWMRWAFIGIARIWVGQRDEPFGVEVQLTAVDATLGERRLEQLLAGFDLHRERGELPTTPPSDELPSRMGSPELEVVEIAKLRARVRLPASWFEGEPSSDRLVSRINAIGNLSHFFGRPGEAAVSLRKQNEPFDFWYDGEPHPKWEIRFDGSVETPAGTAQVRIGSGAPPGPSSFCIGADLLGFAYIEPSGDAPGIALSFSACDTPEAEPLFQRILATLERTG
jgi:hypothetical protein